MIYLMITILTNRLETGDLLSCPVRHKAVARECPLNWGVML